MTDLELQEVFKKRFPKIRSHIIYYSEGKEDRRQDALLGAWQGLKKDPNCTDRYLKNGAKFGINMGSRTKSIDSKGKTAGKRKDVQIVRMDALEADSAASLLADNRSLATDDLAIARISYQRFIASLNKLEKRFVLSKLREELRDKLYKELGQYRFMTTYRACLQKFRMAFEC